MIFFSNTSICEESPVVGGHVLPRVLVDNPAVLEGFGLYQHQAYHSGISDQLSASRTSVMPVHKVVVGVVEIIFLVIVPSLGFQVRSGVAVTVHLLQPRLDHRHGQERLRRRELRDRHHLHLRTHLKKKNERKNIEINFPNSMN